MAYLKSGCFRGGVFYRKDATDIVYGLPGDVPIAGRFMTSPGSGNWTFVVFGDSRDPAQNTTTVISPYLSTIATAIAAEKPDLVLFSGDLVNGCMLTNESPMYTNYSGQFGYWMTAVSSIYNYTTGTGIPLYVIRGNHEDGIEETVAPLLEAYRTTVASGMPKNGPPGEENLTYSFTHKGAKFIADDEYVAHNGLKETVNQTWLNEQLTQDTRQFMFVSGHSPAYVVDNDTEDLTWDIAINPVQRDIFWESLVNNHVPAYFCGHSHMYVRGENRSVQQVVVGNGGAGPMMTFYPANVDSNLTLKYPLSIVLENDQKVGYLVITVHEDSGTFDGVQKVLNPETRTWEVGDTLTIHAR